MAGIFGIVSDGAPAHDILGRMGALMRHGEAEKVDTWVSDRAGSGAGFGVVHLGTVHPVPPIAHDAKSGAYAVLDGEIFAAEAGGSPCPDGMSEAAHMLALFLCGGPEALRDLDGHWSLVVVEADGTTTLITDHFGSRQLLFRKLANGGIAFFSELKGALALSGETLRFDPHGMAQLLMLQAPLDETTTIEGITLVPAGGFIRRCPDGVYETGKYWSSPFLDIGYDSSPPGDWIDEYVTLLKRSVAVRTTKPPLTGATLSSGHDSRLFIAAFPENARPLHTFTFGHPRSYDRRSAKKIARVMRSTHHETDLTRDPYLAGIDDYLWFNDAMVACRHGQIGVLMGMFQGHVGAVLEGVPAAAEAFYMQPFQGFGLYAPIDEDLFLREHFQARMKVEPAAAARLLVGLFSEAALTYPGEVYHQAIGKRFPAFPAIRTLDISIWQRLRRFSNTGARYIRSAVEVRQPLYERALYECSLRMPPALYVDGLKAYAEVLRRLEPKLTRILVDKTMLPPDASLADQFWCWRKNTARRFLNDFAGGRFRPYNAKRTFDASDWLRGAFWENMKSVLLSDSLADRDVFNADEVRKYVTAFDEGRPISKDILWTVYGFELWCRRALDGRGQS